MSILSVDQENLTISIIVPVLNGKKYLNQTIESLSNFQKSSGRHCELIFQNCLSTDGTSDIIDAFCSRNPNSYHHNEKDGGQSDAINKGVSRARGDWVTWLCADDMILPNLWQALEEADHLQADIVYGDVVFIMDDQAIPAVGTETHTDGKLSKNRLIIQQPGTCIRRCTWHEFGGVNPRLNWMMDYDLFLRLESMKRKFHRSRHFVASATIHKDAKTSSGSFKRLAEIWSIIFRSHLRRIGYFRLKPYYVYFLEYVIKNIESREVKSGYWLKLLPVLHRFFWMVGVPHEKDDIEKRFHSLPPKILDRAHRSATVNGK